LASHFAELIDLDDFWNCDETGLYYRGLPNRSLCTVEDDGKNVKLLKDRITILLTASATNFGEKLPPFVIGKSKMLRCLNKRIPNGITWKHNKSAWMTTSLFVEYLNDLDSLMVRKIDTLSSSSTIVQCIPHWFYPM
jgi:hypothetical protein